MKLPDNVARCYTNAIGKLPVEVQLGLHTLSMLGASVDIKFLKALESSLRVQLLKPLTLAEKEGLVVFHNGSYAFCHDRIQESCYGLISEKDRRENHLRHGRCLISRFFDTGADDMLFMAVNQINCGGATSVTETDDYLLFAKYNRIAGQKAISMSQFSAAFSLFRSGISFLPRNHWQDHYEFSLEIFELAGKSALAAGNISAIQTISAEVLRHAKTFDDGLNINFTVFSSLVATSKSEQALEMGLELLSQLGDGLTNDLSGEQLNRQTVQITKLLVTSKPESILNYPSMTDTHKLMAMKILARLQTVAYFSKSILHPFLIIKMVTLTMSSGEWSYVFFRF